MPTAIICDQPYNDWLADTLQHLERDRPKAIVLAYIDGDGVNVSTGYYNCSPADKAMLAANIHVDSVYDCILANADSIVRRAAEIEEEQEDF